MSGLAEIWQDIKSIIQKLNQQADELRNQIYQLQRQKQDLEGTEPKDAVHFSIFKAAC